MEFLVAQWEPATDNGVISIQVEETWLKIEENLRNFEEYWRKF